MLVIGLCLFRFHAELAGGENENFQIVETKPTSLENLHF
jgi:hypothetical protein